MTWQSATKRLNDAVLNRLGGRDYTINVADVEHTLEGLYRAPWSGTAVGGVPVDRPEPVIFFRYAEFLAIGPEAGNLISEVPVEGIDADMPQPMTILDWQPDDGGMVKVRLGGYS